MMRGIGVLFTPTIPVVSLMIPHLSIVSAQYTAPNAEFALDAKVDSIFGQATSRNQEVISQALLSIKKLESSPVCTRVAASHLMNECKSLANAPDSSRLQPEHYLSEVRSEFAAKLAICELRGAQPDLVPKDCDVYIPSSAACDRRGLFNKWFSEADSSDDKLCYPEPNEKLKGKCLKTLQSRSVYWTSYSNALQNAVVMCQASRDGIERENHLKIFKNLTQTMDILTAALFQSAKESHDFLKHQHEFTEQVRVAQAQIRHDVQNVQEKALDTIERLDLEFSSVMQTTIADLVEALAQNSTTAIGNIRRDLQKLSNDVAMESTLAAGAMRSDIQSLHETALLSLRVNHDATMKSHEIIRESTGDIKDKIFKIQNHTESALSSVGSLSQFMETVGEQVQVFMSFWEAWSSVQATFITVISVCGAITIFGLIYLTMGWKMTGWVLAICTILHELSVCFRSFVRVQFPSDTDNITSKTHSDLYNFTSRPLMWTLAGMLMGVVAAPILRQVWKILYADIRSCFVSDGSDDIAIPSIELPGPPDTASRKPGKSLLSIYHRERHRYQSAPPSTQ